MRIAAVTSLLVLCSASACSGDAGTGSAVGNDGDDGIPHIDENELAEPTLDIGFVELEEVDYITPFGAHVLSTGPVSRRSARARLFYRLVPADTDGKQKPLFVFFNGGPGYTSMALMSFGTGPMTLNADRISDPPASNPNSFSRLGNLLYIDARNCGFSYLLADDAETAARRHVDSSSDSFNEPLDAADFVRVVLRVLERHPALRNNRVVLVGESYGGTRAALMLDYLLYPTRLTEEPYLYGDPSLRDELRRHYAAVFPRVPAPRHSPELYAKQFGWQVLIQPLVAGPFQYEAKSALDTRVNPRTPPEVEGNRCMNHLGRSTQWCADIGAALENVPASLLGFSQLMGVEATSVAMLTTERHPGAFRGTSLESLPPESEAWLAALGPLPPYDRYYSAVAPRGISGDFHRNPLFAQSFLRAARFAHTMITNAWWDANVVSEAIVPALNSMVPLQSGLAPFEGARYVGADASGPSESFTLDYAALDGQWSAAVREVYFPAFEHSGHMVTASEPERFFETTRDFLSRTGL